MKYSGPQPLVKQDNESVANGADGTRQEPRQEETRKNKESVPMRGDARKLHERSVGVPDFLLLLGYLRAQGLVFLLQGLCLALLLLQNPTTALTGQR